MAKSGDDDGYDRAVRWPHFLHRSYFPSRRISPDYLASYNDAVIGLGTAAALCVAVTVAAAWIINTALTTDTNLPVKASSRLAVTAHANHDPKLAHAAGFSGSARGSIDPSDALSFDAKWARATTSAYPGAMPLIPQRVELASNEKTLQPNALRPPQSRAKPEIALALRPMHVAELTLPADTVPARAIILTGPPKLVAKWKNSAALPRPHSDKNEIAHSPIGSAVPQVTAIPSEKRATSQQAHDMSIPLPEHDSHTAVYDIAAHTVYLPNGDRLEAHSGLGNKLDDPRYVDIKDQGPTPPNVYDLALREQPFHDVQAIRLSPVDGGSMFGRDGLLAHPYMLGANGQSNGCVSFKDYPAFLQAYLRGEVDRLVVVPRRGHTPARTASADHEPSPRFASNNP